MKKKLVVESCLALEPQQVVEDLPCLQADGVLFYQDGLPWCIIPLVSCDWDECEQISMEA